MSDRHKAGDFKLFPESMIISREEADRLIREAKFHLIVVEDGYAAHFVLNPETGQPAGVRSGWIPKQAGNP